MTGHWLVAGLAALFGGVALANAQLYWRTDGSSASWTSSSWSTGSATTTGGTLWTAGNDAIFTANSLVSASPNTTGWGNITVSDGVTVTVTGSNKKVPSGGAHIYDIGTGAALNWTGQAQHSSYSYTKNGAGTWNIGTVTTAFTGGFTLNAGTVVVSGSTALGSGALTLNGGTIQSSGTVAYTPTGITVGGNFAVTGSGAASFAAPVALGAAIRTITNSQSSGTLTFGGAISGSSGGGLVFAGTGTTILTNAANSYTGGTAINGGTLTLGHATTLSNATGTLGVSGGTLATSVSATTIGSDLTFSSGNMSLNDTGAGSLTLASGRTFTMSGGTLDLTLGSSFDQIVSAGSGTLSFSGGTINFDTTGAGFNYATSYQIFSGFGSTPFSGLTLSGYDTVGYSAAISDAGLLTFSASAIPEPSTYAAWMGALTLGFAAWRRRRAQEVAPAGLNAVAK